MEISGIIPKELRGNIYQLYVVSQARSWNDRPLYLFDEWVSYQNGSILRVAENLSERADSVTSMLEMAAYCAYIALKDMGNFAVLGTYEYLLQRTKDIYEKSPGREVADNYLQAIKDSEVSGLFSKCGWLL